MQKFGNREFSTSSSEPFRIDLIWLLSVPKTGLLFADFQLCCIAEPFILLQNSYALSFTYENTVISCVNQRVNPFLPSDGSKEYFLTEI
jgi:hypothetical protein